MSLLKALMPLVVCISKMAAKMEDTTYMYTSPAPMVSRNLAIHSFDNICGAFKVESDLYDQNISSFVLMITLDFVKELLVQHTVQA